MPLLKASANCLRVTVPVHRVGYYLSTMKEGLNPKQVLAVRCPTCGAAPGQKCALGTGQVRTEPHRDRRLIAAD
jgi:hypothetical protein